MTYDPKVRLRQFASAAPSPPPPPPEPVNAPKPRKTSKIAASPKRKRKAMPRYAHIAYSTDIYEDFGCPRTMTIRDVCASLKVGNSYTLRETFKTAKLAEKAAQTFGTNVCFAYVVTLAEDHEPACLAIGSTLGCRVEGEVMLGRWRVTDTLGGRGNPWTSGQLNGKRFRKSFFQLVKPCDALMSVF